MSERGRLYFMIAPARAGKSTYCRNWLDAPRLLMFGRPRVVVNADSIRLALHGMRFSPWAEEMVHAMKHITIEAQLAYGCDVLVDGTHTTWNSVRQILNIDPEATPVWLEFDREELHRRAVATNQSDLIPVIDKMISQYNKLQSEWDQKIDEMRHASREFKSKFRNV